MGLRIEATPEGGVGQSFIIADGENKRGPGGKLACDVAENALLTATYGADVQTVGFLDGDGKKNFDRKNKTADIPCRVQYEFDTEGQAFAWFRDLQDLVPAVADVTLTLGGVSATCPNCALVPFKVRLLGAVVVEVEYPLRFGVWA